MWIGIRGVAHRLAIAAGRHAAAAEAVVLVTLQVGFLGAAPDHRVHVFAAVLVVPVERRLADLGIVAVGTGLVAARPAGRRRGRAVDLDARAGDAAAPGIRGTGFG